MRGGGRKAVCVCVCVCARALVGGWGAVCLRAREVRARLKRFDDSMQTCHCSCEQQRVICPRSQFHQS